MSKFIFILFIMSSIRVHCQSDMGFLVANWVGVIDNHEQSGGIHGPIGKFFILAYLNFPDSSLLGYKSRYPDADSKKILPGPTDEEWDDGDNLKYLPSFNIIKWQNESDSVLVFIYEHDPGPFRRNDPIFFNVIKRSETISRPVIKDGIYTCSDKSIERAKSRGFETWFINLPEKIKNEPLRRMYIEFETKK